MRRGVAMRRLAARPKNGFTLIAGGSMRSMIVCLLVLAMLPTVLLVILLQKHLVRGLLVTGLGGR